MDQFAEKAKKWDGIPWKQELAEQTYQAIRGKVTPTKTDRLIDFGGGTGLLTLKFHGEVGNITVVDTSQGMLGVLRNKIEQQQLENVDVYDQFLEPGGLPDDSSEIIISMMTLHHIEDLTALFRMFRDILVPGGRVAMVDLAKEDGDFHKPDAIYVHDGFEPETLAEHLREAGFRDIEVVEITSVDRTTNDGMEKRYPILMATAINP